MKTVCKKDRTKTVLNINGQLVEAVTISGLAAMVGKSRNTLLRYERTGVFPPAFLEVGRYRYYPVSLAKRLIPIVRNLPLTRKPDSDMLVTINKLFKEEREKYAN